MSRTRFRLAKWLSIGQIIGQMVDKTEVVQFGKMVEGSFTN